MEYKCADCGTGVWKPGRRCRSCAATVRWATSRKPKREYVIFGDVRYYRQPDGYFRASRHRGNELLHRAVWRSANGPVPDGWHIHHLDQNPANNALSNLVALSPSDHSDEHPRKSPDAAVRERIAEKARQRWTAIKPKPYVCEWCGTAFESRKSASDVRFCAPACNSGYWNSVAKQRRTLARLRSLDRGQA